MKSCIVLATKVDRVDSDELKKKLTNLRFDLESTGFGYVPIVRWANKIKIKSRNFI